MVAHFSQLHQDAHNAKEIAIGEHVPGLVVIDVLIVEQPLPS